MSRFFCGTAIVFGIFAAFFAVGFLFFVTVYASHLPDPQQGHLPPENRNAGVSVEIACTVNCPTQQVPQPGPGPRDTRAALVVEGYGSSNAFLFILINGAVGRTAGIPSSGIFSVTLTGLSPGQTTVGAFAVDSQNLTTPTVSVSIVLHEATTTRIYDFLLPPTIRVDREVVQRGERVIVSGQTFPRASVTVQRFPDRQRQEVLADRSGRWEAIYSTERLIGAYTARGRSLLASGLLSEESEEVRFAVVPLPGREPIPPREPGEAPPPRPEGAPPPLCADLNGDRAVNITDFSILLYNWGAPSNPAADCNGDGQVNLIDLSVMLYWWTG